MTNDTDTPSDQPVEIVPISPFNTPVEPVSQAVSPHRHRPCTGGRLGNKRDKVIQMLAKGQTKSFIAKALGISRAVVRAIGKSVEQTYAAPSGAAATTLAAPCPGVPQTAADHLREKAMLIVQGINEEKIKKASLSSLALATDRLLNRAESLENKQTSLTVFQAIAKEYGITPSHSVSRLTVKQEISVESVQTTDTPSQ